MPRFLKVEGESVWLNLDHLAGLMVRAQLQPVGIPRSADLLEARYEATGAFEVTVFFNDPKLQPGVVQTGPIHTGLIHTGPPQTPHLLPVRVVATREEGETFIRNLLGPLLLDTQTQETQSLETQPPDPAELVSI